MRDKYDVIIVGTGAAACFAAIQFRPEYNILLITKAKLEESDSYLAQGGICVKKDEDDVPVFLEDTLRAGHYENKVDSVMVMIESSQEVIDDLIGYGAHFQKKNDKYTYTKEGGHSTERILYHEDKTGQEITSILLSKVCEKENIDIFEDTTMLDILSKDNKCYGIIVETMDNELKTVEADYTIWACGGIGGLFKDSTNYSHLTGDAIGIAIKKDIKLKDIDYIQIHPTTLYSEEEGKRFLISESVRGEGAVLLNKDGERFVDELLPRDKVSNAIFKQMEKDGTDHVWLSMKTIKKHDIKTRFPNIYNKCLESGIDPYQDMIPVVPACHYLMGGVESDLVGRTSMEFLYAVGETCNNGVHGANRLASNSLLESIVFAKRAAMHIMENKREKDEDVVLDINFEQYKDRELYQKHQKEIVLEEIRKEQERKNG